MKNSIGAIIISILILSCKDKQPGSPNKFSEFIHSTIPQQLTSSPGTCISIGIVRGEGEDVYTYHRSYQDENKPNDTTLYELASITKVFTGLLSARTVDDSLLHIDDPITRYLANKNLPRDFDKITVRHLLTHRAGLPLLLPDISERLINPDWVSLAPYYNSLREDYSTAEFFNDVRTVKLSPPGKKYSYSNLGANLVGYCLASVYKQSYESLLREKIFVPLGMSNTYVQQDKFIPMKGWRDGHYMPMRSASHMNADGGIVSCVADMILFIKYNLEPDKPGVAMSHSGISTIDVGNASPEFFWQIEKEQYITLYHPGGSFGTTSLIMIRPETKSGVFIVTNQAGPTFHVELRKLADSLLNSKY